MILQAPQRIGSRDPIIYLQKNPGPQMRNRGFILVADLGGSVDYASGLSTLFCGGLYALIVGLGNAPGALGSDLADLGSLSQGLEHFIL